MYVLFSGIFDIDVIYSVANFMIKIVYLLIDKYDPCTWRGNS